MARYKDEIDDLESDIGHVIVRCLLIAQGLYKYTHKKEEADAHHEELHETLIKPALEMSTSNINCIAMKCMTLYSLIHQDICDKTEILKLCQLTLIRKGQDLNVYTALKCCFDIFLAFQYLRDEANNAWLHESSDEELEPEINYSEIINLMSYYIDPN